MCSNVQWCDITTQCCQNKRPAGAECPLVIGGVMCLSGECRERFQIWQIIFWFPVIPMPSVQFGVNWI